MTIRVYGNITELPNHGRLIVASDLQGNLDDFAAMVAKYEQSMEETGDAYLLFLGDLIHAPLDYSHDDWPEWLGPYYEDQSVEIVQRVEQLNEQTGGRVLSLLGNHEHSQIGGIWLGRDSVTFENRAGGSYKHFQSLFRQWPLVVTSPCGFVFTHACPSLNRPTTRHEIANVSLEAGFIDLSVSEIVEREPAGPLLWSRDASYEQVARFCEAISTERVTCSISICGHDPVDEGYDKVRANMVVLSTSYRMQQAQKAYLEVDLAAAYRHVGDLVDGVHLKPLYDCTVQTGTAAT